MKIDFTKNIGLKIMSVLAAFILWFIVVNVDDPVISKTYTGITVELLNQDVLTEQNKDYEVLDNSDVISVVVTAKRSVIDGMSKDYIRATADLESLSARNTVPIEVRSVRYSDRIDSVTTRAQSVRLNVEDIVSRSIPVEIEYEGELDASHVLAGSEKYPENVEVSGPQSIVESIAYFKADVDISNLIKDTDVSQLIHPYDADDNTVDEEKLSLKNSTVDITLLIDTVKEIPIESAYSGTPATGYVDTGSVIISPSSVKVSGRGENFSDLKSVNIAPNEVSIEGATGSVTTVIDISEFLPSGVSYYGDVETNVEVTVEVLPTETKIIQVPITNIRVDNLPDGYIANVVDIGGYVSVEIQGRGDTFERFHGELAEGVIDAVNLVPRNIATEGAVMTTGECDGLVDFVLPQGISVVNPVSMMVIVDYVGTDAGINNDTGADEVQNTTENSETLVETVGEETTTLNN